MPDPSPCAGTITIVKSGTTDAGPLLLQYQSSSPYPELELTATISSEGYFPSHKPEWSITKKPTGSSAYVSPTTGGTAMLMSIDRIGEYKVKADCNGNYDEIRVLAYRLEFTKNSSAHKSIEATKTGSPTDYAVLGTAYGDYDSTPTWSTPTLYGNSQTIQFGMWSKGADYNSAHGGGWTLTPSGESWYDVYLDLGSDSASLKVTVVFDHTIGASPPDSHITRGGSCRTKLGSTSHTYTKAVTQNPLQYTTSGLKNGTIVWTGSITNKTKIGEIDAGAAYEDRGASYWQVTSRTEVNYTVEKP